MKLLFWLFKGAGLNDLENLFQDDTDNEINKFTFIPTVKESLEDFKEKCREFIQVFIEQMLLHNQTKEKETNIFLSATVKMQKAIDNESVKIINIYNSKKKLVQFSNF